MSFGQAVTSARGSRSSANELVEEFGAKRVTVVVVPCAAHAIMVEQPGAVADAIIAWVRRL